MLFDFREHDKDPETFLRVIYQLQDSGVDFRLSIIGQTYTDVSCKSVWAEFNGTSAKVDHIVQGWAEPVSLICLGGLGWTAWLQ